ncbi:MAG TPA: restriction endonuclease subunit S [Nitrospirota bacterium]|nr:restriction endonuclease subunit S [Nitrospirota bacterium]
MSHYKPYSDYKDYGIEWLGKVPEHWKITPIKFIVNIFNGATPKSNIAEYWDGDIPWYTPADIDNEITKELGSPRRNITKAGFNSCAVKLAPAGSVILSTRAPIGSIGLTTVPSTINQGCRVLVPEGHVSAKFVAFLLVAARDELRSRGNGTTFQELSTEALRSLRVPIPQPMECASIINHIDNETARIDALIARKTEFIELLTKKRQVLITHAVTKGLDPKVKMKESGVKWLGKVPVHWRVMRFKRIASICNGQDYKDVVADNGVYPVIGSGGEFARASAFMYDGESVLLGRKGTIDKPLYINGPFWVVDTMFYTKIANGACPKFVYYTALTIPFSFYSTNTALPSMTGEDLSSHIVAAPSLIEQRAIASFLDRETARIDALIVKTHLSIDLLKNRRSAFIAAAVTGKIDLRETK